MKCKNCGEEMYPNLPFCPNCGVENKADAIVENEVSVGTPAEATARPTENAVSEPAVMHFEWAGTSKGKKSWVMSVVINGNEMVEGSYQDAWSCDIPLDGCGDEIELKIVVGISESKKQTSFKRVFSIKPSTNYYCAVSGSTQDFTGLGVKFNEGDIELDSTPTIPGSVFGVAFMAFLFPIYGIYKGFTLKIVRNAAFGGAIAGFFLSLIMSSMAEDGDMIGFGFGHTALFEYEPFSVTDIVINLILGGIASLRGFLYMLLD